MKKFGTIIFVIAILAGLFLRCMSLQFMGTFDMTTYHEWGLKAVNEGLYKAYQGIYFPFQYQIFEAGSFLSVKSNIQFFTIYKLINLLFDTGNLVVLYLIFRKINVSKYYLLLYWLHPWFLIMVSQGYCDFQFTFFILCSILFSFKATSRNYLIAGIFLGFAFLMKPQVQVIVLSTFIYSIYIYYKEKEIKHFSIFVFSIILFINYSTYFLFTTGNPFRLLRNYVDIGGALPLTANFLNLWFPVAYHLKEPDAVIYSVTDNMSFLHIGLRTIAVAVLLILIILFIRKIYKNNTDQGINHNYFLIASFSTFVFPFIMTGAHENHLFLATVLLIPVLAKTRYLLIKISIHILLILQCINLYGYYGYGENRGFSMININYTYKEAFILSLIAISAFTVLVFYFLKKNSVFIKSMKQPEQE
jgi:uncharacterized membrane protein (DUF441 family)